MRGRDAGQVDAALGRWFGVDPRSAEMPWASPYNSMGSNPISFIDPDGENPLLIGALFGLTSNGIGNLFNGENFFKGGFDAAFFGAAGQMFSVGAGLGFSAGLNSLGVGVQASNFIGGALSSFSGNILMGGMPTSSFGWASAIGNAALMGGMQTKGNPLGLSRGYDATAVDYRIPNLNGGFIELTPQTITALEGFGTADWHKLFASGVNEVVGGVYGAHDAFANNPFGGAILSAPEMVGGQMAFNVASKWFGGFRRIIAARGVVNTVPRTKDVLGHIFRNAPGHVNPATAASQSRYISLFEKVAANSKNLNPSILNPQAAKNGVQAFTQTFRNGQQVWVHTRNGRIFDAGLNLIPK